MKSQDIDKLYKTLTSHERAAMSFKAMCHQDSDAHNKLKAATPRFTYSQLDNDYTSRITLMFEIASLWSVEYWKNYCIMLAVLVKSSRPSVYKDKEQSESLDDLQEIYQDRLIAQFLLLEALQKTHSLDKKSVIRFADIGLDFSDKSPLESLCGNAQEYYQNWLAYCISLLEHTEPDASVQQYFGWANESEIPH